MRTAAVSRLVSARQLALTEEHVRHATGAVHRLERGDRCVSHVLPSGITMCASHADSNVSMPDSTTSNRALIVSNSARHSRRISASRASTLLRACGTADR
jgi:hypothetical protein